MTKEELIEKAGGITGNGNLRVYGWLLQLRQASSHTQFATFCANSPVGSEIENACSAYRGGIDVEDLDMTDWAEYAIHVIKTASPAT